MKTFLRSNRKEKERKEKLNEEKEGEFSKEKDPQVSELITKVKPLEETISAASKRISELEAENKALKADLEQTKKDLSEEKDHKIEITAEKENLEKENPRKTEKGVAKRMDDEDTILGKHSEPGARKMVGHASPSDARFLRILTA